MTTKEIRWHSFDRDKIPEARLGLLRPEGWGRLEFDAWSLTTGQVAIGFSERKVPAPSDASLPVVILLGEGKEADLLSWLHAYATEIFPLSQFARVLTSEDWTRLRQPIAHRQFEGAREDRWACVTLGEALAQGDADIELAALPLSRASACFSAAMARAVLVHGSEEATKACVERLTTLEMDRRFVRRAVGVTDLLPIWALLGAGLSDTQDAGEVAQMIVQAAASHGAMHRAATRVVEDVLTHHLDGFASDSVEERVVAFHRLAQSVSAAERDDATKHAADVVLAAGAFLVGRSTSHAFLLRKSAKLRPSAFAWFALMAALMGPRGWDPTWSRTVKGIERQLRASFEWTDPASADLCWLEYAWMAKVFEGVEAFVELPKLFPRVLSVEVIPGAACQFRLAVESGLGGGEGEQRDKREQEYREQELRVLLEQFVGLALRARPLLDRGDSSPGATRRQQSLPLGEEASSKRATRAKRPRRDTD